MTTLSSIYLEKIVKSFRTLIYPKNQIVIKEGEIGDLFYIIARGRVGIFKTTSDGIENQVALMEDGDYFGEIALIKDIPRTATVRTLTMCTFLVLYRSDFMTILTTVPEVKRRLEQRIENKMQ